MDERKESMQAAEEAIAAENRNGGAGKAVWRARSGRSQQRR